MILRYDNTRPDDVSLAVHVCVHSACLGSACTCVCLVPVPRACVQEAPPPRLSPYNSSRPLPSPHLEKGGGGEADVFAAHAAAHRGGGVAEAEDVGRGGRHLGVCF